MSNSHKYSNYTLPLNAGDSAPFESISKEEMNKQMISSYLREENSL